MALVKTLAAAGERLDQAVARVAEGSRSTARAAVEAGLVTVDGKLVERPAHRLAGGEHVVAALPDAPLAPALPEALQLKVLFEDVALVAIDKPPGMPTHPAGKVRSGTVVNALLGTGALSHADTDPRHDEYRPGIVHRLDKDTSGVIIVARSDRAHARLADAFHDREVDKRYLAILEGALAEPVRVDAPIGRDPADYRRMRVGGMNARDAVTEFSPCALAPGHTLVVVRLETGRTHQIRVHARHLGHPVLGDRVYGHEAGVIGRQALHSWRLVVPHPSTGKPLALEAPPPQDLIQAWRLLAGQLPDLAPWRGEWNL